MEDNVAESNNLDVKNNEGEILVEAKTEYEEAKPNEGVDTENKINNIVVDEKEGEEATIEVAESTSPTPSPPSPHKVIEDVDRYLDENANIEEAEATFNMPDFIYRYLEFLEEKFAPYDSCGVKGKWGDVKEEDLFLIEALHRIYRLMRLFARHSQSSSEDIKKPTDLLINHIDMLKHRVMSYFEEEFQYHMEEKDLACELKGKQQVEQDTESTDLELEFPSYPEETIVKLKQLSNEMILGGYDKECSQIYMINRRCAFEGSLHKMGFEKMSIDEILKTQWGKLEINQIPIWIKTFKDCAGKVYLSNERELAELVFEENPALAVTIFSDLSRCFVMHLLNFAVGVAMTNPSMEKLFKNLDMYETLRDSIPIFEQLLPEEVANELKTDTTITKSRLGENIINILGDAEMSIKTYNVEKTLVTGGAYHPITRYCTNYLDFASVYKDTIEQVIKEHSKMEHVDPTSRPHFEREGNPPQDDDNNSGDIENESPFVAYVIRMMSHLDRFLEGKAKLYKDAALSCIFMMNNGRYILQRVKESEEMYSLLGETWCRKRSSDLRNYHKNYQRETWAKILNCFASEGLSLQGKLTKPVLKERFKSFNSIFDEIHRTQSTWVVNDEQLKTELRVSITALVVPAYRAFLGRYSRFFRQGRQTEKYIKYQVDEVENLIDQLFDGSPQTRKKP